MAIKAVSVSLQIAIWETNEKINSVKDAKQG